MDENQKQRETLIQFFQNRVRAHMADLEQVDESQVDLLEAEILMSRFTLTLLEEGVAEFHGEKINLSDKKIELLYKEYIG